MYYTLTLTHSGTKGCICLICGGCHLCSVILENIEHLRRTAGGASMSGNQNLGLDLWLTSLTNYGRDEANRYLEVTLRGTFSVGQRNGASIQVENKALKRTYPRVEHFHGVKCYV